MRVNNPPAWDTVYLSTDYGDALKFNTMRVKGEVRARALILHGLTGCSYAPPTPQVAEILSEYGVECWALNMRGADRSVPEVPRLYHAGCTEDLEAVFQQLPQDRPWSFIGYSMGANILLKWLGENPEREFPGGKALAVSCPFDIGEITVNLEKTPMTRFYRYFLVHQLKSLVRNLSKKYPDVLPKERIDSCRTFREFDESITAPLHGFLSAEDYWSQCSSEQFLPRITLSTTLLHAMDDPFQPNPPTWIESPHIRWELYQRGGHLGFVEGWGKDWLAHKIVDFVLSPANKAH